MMFEALEKMRSGEHTGGKEDIMTLHIIGNGLDLAHDMESTYGHFERFAWKHAGKRGFHLGLLEEVYPGINRKTGRLELWSDLEKTLGNPDIKQAYALCTEDIEAEEDHEIRYQPAMEDAPQYMLPAMFDSFQELFDEWVNSIVIYEDEGRVLPHFEADGLFFSFNYTETLEELYHIPRERIKYIHGRRNTSDDLIVGHCNDVDGSKQLPVSPMIYEYEGYNNVARAVNERRKKVSDIIESNIKYWRLLHNVNKVVVYGHSLSEVDLPYFRVIAKHVMRDAEWCFSIYYKNILEKNKEVDKVRKFIKLLNLDEQKCQTFVM